MGPAPVVDNERDALRVVEEVRDPRRSGSLIGVSMSAGREHPLIDVEELSDAFGTAVRILRTGPATWALKRWLPPGLDVFGDAVRVWRPGSLEHAEHPLLVLPEELDPTTVVRRLHDLVGDHRIDRAVVSSVDEDGAVLELADRTAIAVQRHQVTNTGLPPTRVLRIAQEVDVLLVGEPTLATLRPLEPDPVLRLLADHPPGSVVLGRPLPLTRTGDRPVELLPGVRGIVPAAERGPSTWGDQELVAVEVLDEDLRLAPRRAGPDDRAASVHPDGPPWLVASPLAAELPPLAGPPAWRAPSPAPPSDDGVVRLHDLVTRATAARDDVRAMSEGLDDHLDRVRATAAALRHELELDLADLRHRVMTVLTEEHDVAGRMASEALDSTRAEIRSLRERLSAAEAERGELREQLADSAASTRRHRLELAKAREAAAHERDRARALQRELDLLVPAAERFQKAARRAWLRNTTKADREEHPWRTPLIGPHFLASLERLEGVGIDRVLDVCAEVACGRAPTRSGLQVHALRWSSGAGVAQQSREDGARAFRASLQVRSAAARRLHYWVLPDGTVELAQIGYHDDFTIR